MTLALLLVLHSSLATPAVAIGVTGAVDVEIDGHRKPVARFDELPAGATLVTATASSVQVRLASGSLLRIGPSSRLTLTMLEHADPAGHRKETVRLIVGRFWARVTSLFGGDSKFEVETTNAVAGVRGTSFVVEASGDQNRFVLLDGVLHVAHAGATVDLDQPGAFLAAAGGELGAQGTLTADSVAALLRSIAGPGPTLLTALGRRAPPPQAAPEDQRAATRRDIVGPTGLVDSPTGPAAPTGPTGEAIIDVQITVDRGSAGP